MGRPIWILNTVDNIHFVIGKQRGIRVLSFKQFLPANGQVGRKKHLVQIWTDPGGLRTLSVGSICLQNPTKVEAGRRAAAAAASIIEPHEEEDE